MPIEDQLSSRRAVVDVVKEFLKRQVEQHRLPYSRYQPVLVFEGTNGTGKSELVARLTGLVDGDIPYACLDFRSNQHATPAAVLSALAFQLSRHCRGCRDYPVLKFGRLLAGLLIMNADIDPDDQRAGDRVQEILLPARTLERWQEGLQAVARGIAVIARERTAAAGGPVEVAETLIDNLPPITLANWRIARRIVLRQYANWWGNGDLDRAVDELVELNRLAKTAAHTEGQPGDPAAQQALNERLIDAFLADLRDEFANAGHQKQLTANVIIMLDNADTALGKQFLAELASARATSAARGPDIEPLTVLTTSRGGLLTGLPGTEVSDYRGDAASVADTYATRKPGLPQWLRYRLPDLTDPDIGELLASRSIAQISKHQLVQLVRNLTGGHPATTRLLLDGIAVLPRSDRQRKAACETPATVLTQLEPESRMTRAPGTQRLTVAERMLAELTDEAALINLPDLVTSSAALSRMHAVQLATGDNTLPDGGKLLTAAGATYLRLIDPVLWPARSDAGAMLRRRLLLGKLAQRESGWRPRWPAVFGWHRDRCATANDLTGELYYALACGEVGHVADVLLGRLADEPARAWLELLDRVTLAPHRPHYAAPPVNTPLADADELVGDPTGLTDDRRNALRLVAGLQILASPFTGAQRDTLHLQVSTCYTTLAGLAKHGRELLFTEALKHHGKAELWTTTGR